MDNDESTDPRNNNDDNRLSNDDQEKVPGKKENSWEHDIFDDTDPNLRRKDPKDPKHTLFY
ncbi:MAG TPA: hypothetical protein VH815_04895 [Acidobacteriota bacterium]|jgi:hypothetical protein